MVKFKHYIFTRFTYPPDYPYINERIKIFHEFTKPSFESQTSNNFTWLISINRHYDYKNLLGPFKNINVEFVSKFDAFKSLTDYVLTSRIDNDDIIHQDYVAHIQELFLKNQSTRIIDGPGYRYLNKTKEIYTFYNFYSKNKCSPFSTLVCPYKQNLTVFCANHGQLSQKFDVEFHDKKLWLQHIHNTNALMKGGGEQQIQLDLTPFNINI